MYQSFGQDYSKIAVCQLVFRDIFDKPNGRIHGTASLTGGFISYIIFLHFDVFSMWAYVKCAGIRYQSMPRPHIEQIALIVYVYAA